MSELITTNRQSTAIRLKLLAGASIAVIGAHVCAIDPSKADEADRPQVWIELGGQAERLGDRAETFSPSFFADTPESDLLPMIKAQKIVPYSLGLQGKLTFSPEKSNWTFSASALYGRSNSSRHDHQQTPLPYTKQFVLAQILPQPGAQQFGDGQGSQKESHLILDFQAGKDVGIGLFGSELKSTIGAGVRFAQFTEGASVTLNARPYNKLGNVNAKYFSVYRSTPPPPHYVQAGVRVVNLYHHTFAATAAARRSAFGIGPSVSWSASLPISRPQADSAINVDWGLNAAVLFGRQRAHVNHKTSGRFYSRTGLLTKYHHTVVYAHNPAPRTTSRRVTIPNVGGFAALSLKFPNAQFSMGYRADIFFGAIDGGIDSVKSQNRSFYGPFATVSIGLGG